MTILAAHDDPASPGIRQREANRAAFAARVASVGVMPPAPALRCAVLAWGLDPNTADPAWIIIFANGDEGAARQAAADWLERNPDGECQLMIAQPEGRARRVTRVEWGK